MNHPTHHRKYLIVPLLLAAGVAACLAGCGKKEEDIRAYSAPKEETAPPPTVASARPNVTDPPQWTVPDDWAELQRNEFQYALYAVSPTVPSAQFSVAFTASAAPLVGNVNRWERQLGLPPTPEAEVPGKVTMMSLPAGEAGLVNLIGAPSTDPAKPQQRILVAIVQHGDSNWYFRLSGPASIVDAQKPKFDGVVNSVRFGEGAPIPPSAAAQGPALPQGHPPIGSAEPAAAVAAPTVPPASGQPSADSDEASGLKWTTPAGWTRKPIDASAMIRRVLSFNAPAAQGAGDVAVTELSADSFGSLEGQVNRWRGQVSLPPAAQVNEKDGEPVKVSGQDAVVFDFTGPEKRIVVTYARRGNNMLFFKMSGPASAVGTQKDAFKAFVSSVQF